MNNKLEVKDFINVGLFATIMIGYIPVLIPVLMLFTGITGGLPFMLFLTRVKKFGMVLIFGLICGLPPLTTGSGFYPLLTAVVSSLIADLILKSGRYGSGKRLILAYGIFCLWTAGFFLHMDRLIC